MHRSSDGLSASHHGWPGSYKSHSAEIRQMWDQILALHMLAVRPWETSSPYTLLFLFSISKIL